MWRYLTLGPGFHPDAPLRESAGLPAREVKMSRADKNYAKQEEEAVKKATKILGVEDDITQSLNILVEMEEKVESMLKALIHTETL